ncbi:hypothetical protein NDU88_008305 [Pleurodeles waltl]|uniref:Uncharacterized protein n=1 Tax=Pleurodeles waltl TaxID=8319 RepID=A0AAV7NYX3_PLEWA|nr:hypothetical protein NDU88_008305 [Pleurodeles waltl]
MPFGGAAIAVGPHIRCWASYLWQGVTRSHNVRGPVPGTPESAHHQLCMTCPEVCLTHCMPRGAVGKEDNTPRPGRHSSGAENKQPNLLAAARKSVKAKTAQVAQTQAHLKSDVDMDDDDDTKGVVHTMHTMQPGKGLRK